MIYKVAILSLFCLLYNMVHAIVTQRQAPECRLPRRSGNCIQTLARYYYNTDTGDCETFLYSGCGGNLNNFKTLDECNGRCVCSQPVVTGNGTKSIERYYYDVIAQRCKSFIYTGEGGNRNRFRKRSNCKAKCENTQVREKCDIRPNRGFHCATEKGSRQFYFDSNCNCCRSFRYLGCGGNTNRFPTYNSCKSTCSIQNPPKDGVKPVKCSLQPIYGNCTEELIRYYFNSVADKCVPFVYSGCGGNNNNFGTLERCNKICDNSTTALGVAQFLQIDEQRKEITSNNNMSADTHGSDTTAISDDLSDIDSLLKLAEGSGLVSGETTVAPTTNTVVVPEECLPAPNRGDCVFNLKRYFYDKDLMMCRPFAWSGCGGNSNRFYSEIQCETTCVFN
ncbi:hypothetical protein ACF0H5_009351 [Mactra antiquata]